MKKYEMDMCSGPLLKKMIKFSVPILLTVLFQQLFNTADLVVVGEFGHPGALAAVGATGSATNLLVNFFGGFSLGAGICLARYYGAKQEEQVSKCVHTAILLSLVGGIIMAVLGIFVSRPILELMGTPVDVIDQSTIYMQIYFAGMPFMMLFNFCASMLRSVGDSRRTLYYICTAGVINVILNLIFVIVFDLNVAGVAAATVIAQSYSAFMSVRCFLKYDGCLHLDAKKLKIDLSHLKSIAILGIPSGVQGSLFSASNVLIQSSVNSFGTAVMSGSTAASSIEGYIYVVMNSISTTVTNFTGQNFGAGNFKRIRRVLWVGNAMTMVIAGVLAIGVNVFSEPLLGCFTKVPEEIEVGAIRLLLIAGPYFLCGLMENFSGVMKGTCHPISSMIVSLIGACLFRIVWILTVFKKFRSLNVLWISYSISWTLTTLVLAVMLFIYIRKDEKLFAKKL